MGFRHVGQDGLNLLASSDAPTIALKSAGIVGVSHHAHPNYGAFKNILRCLPFSFGVNFLYVGKTRIYIPSILGQARSVGKPHISHLSLSILNLTSAVVGKGP